MTDKQDPMTEGREAYLNGESFHDCPYDDDTVEAMEWEGGWMEANDEECD